MKRIHVPLMRDNWKKKVESIGFHFYEIDNMPYWDESVYYEFTSDQIDHLEEVTVTLYSMCLELVEYVIKNNLYEKLAIPEAYFEYAKKSWLSKEPSIYGRFDLWYDGISEPKLLEFNADTPTALFEASVVQYYWLQELNAEKDQFNSIHEKLLDVMQHTIKRFVGNNTLYFSCVKESVEDYTTTEYMRDIAMQAGLSTQHIFIDDIGYDYDFKTFVDLEEREIRYLFKLYPWEWLISEQFAEQLLTTDIALFEPAWKMVLSNKAMLPLLWEMYPNHNNLLPAFYRPPNNKTRYLEKPFFSREGEDISVDDDFTVNKHEVIYQEYKELPNYEENYPVVGSWVIGGQPAGMGIREDMTPITNNLSRFVPHLFS